MRDKEFNIAIPSYNLSFDIQISWALRIESLVVS